MIHFHSDPLSLQKENKKDMNRNTQAVAFGIPPKSSNVFEFWINLIGHVYMSILNSGPRGYSGTEMALDI
jgi:hypothetical protein